MNAIQLPDYGPASSLHLANVPRPPVGAGALGVAIHAAAVNPLDLKLASGAMRQLRPLTFPWTPGIDLSGVVTELGEGVTGFAVGDEVYASLPGDGAYAEFTSQPAALFSHKPQGLSHAEAAAVSGVGQTAWQALFDQGQLQAGQRVLIHGASGGVGTLAVPLARWKGATVIASASQEQAAFMRDLGADEVIDSRDPAAMGGTQPVDLLIDAVGGPDQNALFDLVRPGGRFIALTQPPAEAEAGARGITARMLLTQPSGDTLRAFEGALAAGAVRPIVQETFPLAEAARAWARQAQGGVRGKLVLTVTGEG